MKLRSLVESAIQSGISQRILAQRVGVSHGTVNNILAGILPRRLDILQKFATYFGLPLEQLLETEPHPPQPERTMISAESAEKYNHNRIRPAESPPRPPKPIDLQMLKIILEEVEAWLSRHERVLAPEKKAEVVVLLYEYGQKGAVEPETIGRILRLAV